MGVADVEDQIDIHYRLLQGSGQHANIGQRQLGAQQLQQVEIVRLIFKLAQRHFDFVGVTCFLLGGALGKDFAQPAVNPGEIEEFAQLIVMPGQREADAVVGVVWRQH